MGGIAAKNVLVRPSHDAASVTGCSLCRKPLIAPGSDSEYTLASSPSGLVKALTLISSFIFFLFFPLGFLRNAQIKKSIESEPRTKRKKEIKEKERKKTEGAKGRSGNVSGWYLSGSCGIIGFLFGADSGSNRGSVRLPTERWACASCTRCRRGYESTRNIVVSFFSRPAVERSCLVALFRRHCFAETKTTTKKSS